ncbi:MAG: Flagellar brake protein YcgR [Candidatus Erwinia impunctatus]|nr:Flagellar brake protein YcgR [Culicoides impunctatus]
MDEDLKQQFAKHNPLAIKATLGDLPKQSSPLIVKYAGGQFISQLLNVLPDNDGFIFDLGSKEQQRELTSYSSSFTFIAELNGAGVEFAIDNATLTDYEGQPAFAAPLPDRLYLIQRRSYFRINTQAWPPLTCRGQLEDSTPFALPVRDISLGGLCVYTREEQPLSLTEHDIIRNVTLDLQEHGTFTVDIQFISQSQINEINHKSEVKSLPRLSFKFHHLSAAQERDLQRVIFNLEREEMNKKRKFQD